MTTVILVHGTGTREPYYSEMFAQVQQQLTEHRPDVRVERCYWGDTLGSRLHQNGASIPLYDSTRAIETVTDKEMALALWSMLEQDPLYELRTLALRSSEGGGFVPGRLPPGEQLRAELAGWQPSANLQQQLDRGGVSTSLHQARQDVLSSSAYLDAIQGATEPLNPYRVAVARAIVARAIALAGWQPRGDGSSEEDGLVSHYVRIAVDATLRDEVVQQIAAEFGPSDKGLFEWAGKQLWGIALQMGAMDHVQRRRGAITNAVFPFAGDVILYQSRGDKIRGFIRDRVNEVSRHDPDVVLLAHSLGGIACVDLLVMERLPAVRLLVTVGSQAPFLYEIGALHSLAYGEPLPPHAEFPPWLNIYDLRDFLSYIGANVFPSRVDDVLVDNGVSFPNSHGAYWTNPAVWNAIMPRLPE